VTSPALGTPEWEAALKRELGTDVDLDDAAERYQRFIGAAVDDPLTATIVEMLEQRLADFVAGPATFNVGQEYSQSTSANITALQKQIEEIRAGQDPAPGEDGAGFGVIQLRPKRRTRGRCRSPFTPWTAE
jgi:hypothetical protein